MSKATIKMCLSSTGFGSQVKFSQQIDEPPMVSNHFERQIPQSNFTSIPSRPPPRFDDNLKDLFSDNWLSSDGRISESQAGPYVRPQFKAPYIAPRPSFSPSNTSSLSPSTGSTYQQQQPPDRGPSFYPHTTVPPVNDNTNDLLNYDNMYDFDFLVNNDVPTSTGESGLHLGFDGNHDWADGGSAQLPNLFGGFFFGGPPGEDVGVHTTPVLPVTENYDALGAAAATSMWNEPHNGS